jgi:DNA modification methylase
MNRVLRLSMADFRAEQWTEADDDHYSRALVRAVVEEYTAPGDRVFDPFAGFGTTLIVSEELGRVAVGIELLPERVDIIRGRVSSATTQVIQGDVRRLEGSELEAFDLCLTSPPYMPRHDHPWNPLTGYETLDANYDVYLDELGTVFTSVAVLLRPGGHLAVNVANMRHEGRITALAWDVARLISDVPGLEFRGETYLEWDAPPDWMQGDYLLIFRKRYRTAAAGY